MRPRRHDAAGKGAIDVGRQGVGRWSRREAIGLTAGSVAALALGRFAEAATPVGGRRRAAEPSGRYKVTFEGEGTLQYSGNARIVESGPGRHVLDVDSSQTGIALCITATNPSNYLRNIYVAPPVAGSDGQIFHPTFLDRIKRYRA